MQMNSPANAPSSHLGSVLAAIGLTMTAAASLFTYRSLHEPLEAVGASVVSHLAASHCTAIAQTLAGLALARSDELDQPSRVEPAWSDPNSVIGVLTPGLGRLETYHGAAVTKAHALAILQRLPHQRPESKGPPLASTAAHREGWLCPSLNLEPNPTTVRVFSIPNPTKTHHHAEARGPWLALLGEPFQAGGKQREAFALVNLQAASLQISGHEPEVDAEIPSLADAITVRQRLAPRSILSSPKGLRQALAGLPRDDQQLMAVTIVPFANQLLSVQIRVDHAQLDRLSWRMTGLVAAIGLAATGTLVLVSRRSEGQLLALNESLMQESRTDGLTRVANRRAWDEALTLEEGRRQRYGYRYGLVVVDLDGFKRINDQAGHSKGDAVLQQAAERLQEQLRTTDLVARVGGDEFALLVCNPEANGLEELVNRLRSALKAVGIEASMGAALSEGGATLEQTWANADAAMYAMKATAQT